MGTIPFRPGELEKPPTVPGGKRALPQRLVNPVRLPMPGWQKLLIVAVVLVVLGMVVLIVTQPGMRSGPTGIISIFFPLMLMVSMFGMIAGGRMQGGGERPLSSSELDAARKDFFNTLDDLGDEAQDIAQAQFEQAQHFHPEPALLRGLVGSARMWERQPSTAPTVAGQVDGKPVEPSPQQLAALAFGWVRIGVGRQQLAVEFTSEDQGDPAEYEPATFEAERDFDIYQQTVAGIPKPISLRAFAGIGFVGRDGMEPVYGLVRSMVLQAAVFHPPRTLQVMVLTDDATRWDWLKWLPHAQHPDLSRADTGGAARMVWTSTRDLENAVGHEIHTNRGHHGSGSAPIPHLLVICDQERVGSEWDDLTRPKLGGVAGVTFVRLASQRGTGLEFTDKATHFVTAAEVTDGAGKPVATPDYLDEASARMIARKMARHSADMSRSSAAADAAAEDGAASPDLGKLLGIEDALSADLDRHYAKVRSGPPNDSTPWSPDWGRFPYAVDEFGEIVALDFKETKDKGMGNHMAGIGFTGSGKSEFLKTLITSMCLTHPPELLNVAFFDFKGSTTADAIRDFLHVVAAVTDVRGDILMDRMTEGIRGEADRRKRKLAAVKAKDVAEYESWRIHRGENLEPLPWLYIIVDEFTQWFADKGQEARELADFIARQGRGLGMSLIMMSQYLGHELGAGQGAMKNVPIRVALRVLDENDSREIIGVPDAKHLPQGAAGAGYLRVIGASRLVRFQSAYVSKEYTPPEQVQTAAMVKQDVGYVAPKMFTALPMEPLPAPDPAKAAAADVAPPAPAPKLLGADGRPLKQIEAYQRSVHRSQEGSAFTPHAMWCPPLESLPADELVRRLRNRPWYEDYGSADRMPLLFAVGLDDRPFEHVQRVYAPDVTDANCLVPGRGTSGRTTALTTMILSAALTYTPQRVQFAVVAMSGTDINTIKDLPHVASFARGDQEERVRRSVAEMLTLIAQREADFQAMGIDIAKFRSRKFGEDRGKGLPVPEDVFGGDVFLVIDGFRAFRERYQQATARPGEGLLADIEEIGAKGPAHGVHLIISTDGYIAGKATPTMGTLFSANVELKLPDTDELNHNPNPHVAKAVPYGLQEVISDDASVEQQLSGEQVAAQRIVGRGRTRFGHHFQTGRPWLTVNGRQVDASDAEAAAMIGRIAGKRVSAVRMLPKELSRAQMWERYVEREGQDRRRGVVPFGLSEVGLNAAVADFTRNPHFVLAGTADCGKTAGLATFAQSIMDVYRPDEAKIYVISTDNALVQYVPQEYLGEYQAREFAGDGQPRVPTGKMLYGYVSREDQIMDVDAHLGELLRPRLRPDDATQEEIASGARRWSGPEIFVIVDNEDVLEAWHSTSSWSGKPFALQNVAVFVPRAEEVGLHVIVARRIEEWPKAEYTPLMRALKQKQTPGLVMSGARTEGVILGKQFASDQPAGRGVYVTRDVAAPAQVALPDPVGTPPRWSGRQQSTPSGEL